MASTTKVGPKGVVSVAKEPVRVITNAALPAYTYSGGVISITATQIVTVDGVNTLLGDRIGVKNGAAAKDNGIYVCTLQGTAGVAGKFQRDEDASDTYSCQDGILMTAGSEGTALAGSSWFAPGKSGFTLDTDALNFSRFDGGGGSIQHVDFPASQAIALGAADTALTAQLSQIPTTTGAVLLFQNGAAKRDGAGKDFTVSGKVITWLTTSGTAGAMTTNDVLAVYYASNV